MTVHPTVTVTSSTVNVPSSPVTQSNVTKEGNGRMDGRWMVIKKTVTEAGRDSNGNVPKTKDLPYVNLSIFTAFKTNLDRLRHRTVPQSCPPLFKYYL